MEEVSQSRSTASISMSSSRVGGLTLGGADPMEVAVVAEPAAMLQRLTSAHGSLRGLPPAATIAAHGLPTVRAMAAHGPSQPPKYRLPRKIQRFFPGTRFGTDHGSTVRPPIAGDGQNARRS